MVVARTRYRRSLAARGDALRRGTDEIAVVGGADIYPQAMALATRLLVTEVHRWVEGDAYFPSIDPKLWRETARSRKRRPPATKFQLHLSATSASIDAAAAA